MSSTHFSSGPQKPPLLKKVARIPPDWRASSGEAPTVMAVARRAERVASVNCIMKIGRSIKTLLEGNEGCGDYAWNYCCSCSEDLCKEVTPLIPNLAYLGTVAEHLWLLSLHIPAPRFLTNSDLTSSWRPQTVLRSLFNDTTKATTRHTADFEVSNLAHEWLLPTRDGEDTAHRQ